MLHSICQQIWKTQQWPQDRKRSVFIPILKKGNAKECSNCHTIALISNASKVMLKILQAGLQECVNRELQKRQRNQRSNCQHLLNHWKSKCSRKTTTSAFLTTPKPLTMCITTNCGKFLKEMGIPDHLTCLLRNLYAGQEATVRTVHWTTDWFQIGKKYVKAVFWHPTYLTYMQSSTSWEILDCLKHKLESRLLGGISVTSDMQITYSGSDK